MSTTGLDRISGLRSSIAWKVPVRAATTANISLSGEQTVDGVALVTGDRVLVKNQTDSTENGIYDVAAGAWSRSLDMNGANEVAEGSKVFVNGGTLNLATVFTLTTSAPVIGTSSLTFSADAVGGGQIWSVTTSGVFQCADSLTGDVMLIGTDNVARFISFSGGRAEVGYNGADLELKGGTTKGVSISVDNGTIIARFDDANENIGFGTENPAASALLEMSSTTQGFLPPRMTGTQRDAISSPATGLVIYNTSTSKLNFYNGASWEQVTSA